MKNPPRWLIKLLAEARKGTFTAKPGAAIHIGAFYDDWCDRLNGRDPCNCDPDIRRLAGPPVTREGG